MRRWMRDRGKRRKQQPAKQGQENPAPLQPKFPDPVLEGGPTEAEPADFRAQAWEADKLPDLNEPPPEAEPSAEEAGQQQQMRRDRSRRRGRRGRGGRPQTPGQAPALP